MRFASFLRVFCCLTFTLFTLSAVQLPRAQAATITVSNPSDNSPGSLRQSIANATAGDTIFIGIGGTITLSSGQITIDKNLIIDGGTQNVAITGGSSRIFNIVSGVTVELRNLTLRNGNAPTGGAILSLGTLTISNSIFSNNNATSGVGGAISNNNSNTFTITNSTFTSNTSTGGGGAIHNTGPLTITGSTFSANVNTGVEAGAGGAVFNTAGAMSIVNSTFVNNSSQGFGGGAFSASEPTTVDSSTFLGNGGAGNLGIIAIDAQATISRSIISGSACFTFNGALIDGGNNIGFNTTDCVGTNVDPMLGTFGPNGGVTQTIPLRAGSPAIDVYTTGCLAADQRGTARPQGAACDIGAFELVPNSLFVTNLNESGAGSLRDTVAAAPTGYTIYFGVSGTITLTSGTINISRNLIIDGTGRNITIIGNMMVRLFQIGSSSTTELRNLKLQNNFSPTVFGGGILNNGVLTITNVSIGAKAATGGAIQNTALSNLTVNNSTLAGNTASTGSGGALYSTNATVVINNSSITSNNITGVNNGGAIFQSGGTLTISNSFFGFNRSNSGGGGAIAYDSGTVNITNSTFNDNSAANGGAVHAINSGALNIDSSTFFSNTASTGGTISHSTATVTVSRSIIMSSSCSGTIADGGNNIAFNATACPGINTDPMLGKLRPHGGTTSIYPLLPDSPAIDAYSSNCPVTDQRGIARSQGTACDIGAYEVYRGTLTVTNLNDSGAGSLRNAIATAIPDTTINFSVSGTIILASTLTVDRNIILDGIGQNVTLSGNNALKIMQISSDYIVQIRNLSFINGYIGMIMGAVGAAINNSGSYLLIDNSLFSGNTIHSGANGAAIGSTGTLIINNSTFSGNSISNGGGSGGAVSNIGSLTVNNSLFTGNSIAGNGRGGGDLYQ